MRTLPRFLLLSMACLICASCQSTTKSVSSKSGYQRSTAKSKATIRNVRTTAYTHTEADHIRYGKKNAIGTQLNETGMRSAAADWSVYPVGTVFKIKGQNSMYMVDDYGSALVGSNTIDIYQPDKATMKDWGVRHVDIDVVRWGSRNESIRILEPRAKWSHVRQMVTRLKGSGSGSVKAPSGATGIARN